MQRLVPKALALARRAAASRHPAHHRCGGGGPAGSVLGRDRGAGAGPGHPRLAGSGSGGAGLLQARLGCHRLGRRDRARDRQTHDGAAGQGRVLGQRDQARQERGLDGYPVYTRKVTTDVSYLACAGQLFKHTDVILPAVRDSQCPQHRLRSGAWRRPARSTNSSGCTAWGGSCTPRPRARSPNFPPVRVYAPVGEHKDLLAYLVRRLLENGANTSFVNRFMDEQVPVADIVRDPITELERLESYRASALPNPVALYAEPAQLHRDRSRQSARARIAARGRRRAPLRGARRRDPSSTERRRRCAGRRQRPITNPADRRESVGNSRDATPAEIARAFDAGSARPSRLGPARRRGPRGLPRSGGGAAREVARSIFTSCWCARRARPISDAIAEVREAVDFCRYYALRAREEFAQPTRLEGPTGELNELSLHGRGVFACISPWNFPLAIFAGQVTAALGRRQWRRREARRADAADRRALRRALARGRRRAARRCT